MTSIFDTTPGHETIETRSQPHPMTAEQRGRRTTVDHVRGDIHGIHAAVNRIRTVTDAFAANPALGELVDAALEASRAGVSADVLGSHAAGLRSATASKTGPNPVIAPEVADHIARTIPDDPRDIHAAATEAISAVPTMTAAFTAVPVTPQNGTGPQDVLA